MRKLAYFWSNYLTGMDTWDAWEQAREETEADKPRRIDYSMDSEEWDNWPYDSKPEFETSHRKTIWQILTRD